MDKNERIRNEIKRSGVAQWRIAAYIGVAESTLIRWLRFPLTDDRESKIRAAIASLSHSGA